MNMPDRKPDPSHPQQPPGTSEPPLLEPGVEPGARARSIHRRQVASFLAGLSLALPLAASFSWLRSRRRASYPVACPNAHPPDPVPPCARSQPAAPEPAVAPADRTWLEIELTARLLTITRGEQPELEAFLVNAGSRPATVILPGDGSEVGWRTPIVRWDPPATGHRRCGNVNAATMDEIVLLQPGARVALGWLGSPTFDGPGTYAVTLELMHDPDLEWRGVPLGEHPPDVMARIRSVPAYRVRSNVVEIRVRE
jgi:hypothetical protein